MLAIHHSICLWTVANEEGRLRLATNNNCVRDLTWRVGPAANEEEEEEEAVCSVGMNHSGNRLFHRLMLAFFLFVANRTGRKLDKFLFLASSSSHCVPCLWVLSLGRGLGD